MSAKTPAISLKALDARTASEAPFSFEYISPDGSASGVTFTVLGGQSATVQSEINRLVNERRRKQHAAEINARTGGRKSEDFTSVESDIEFGQRLAAIRLVGWSGIAEPFHEDLALELCQSNADIATQITEQSNDMANFMKSSSPT